MEGLCSHHVLDLCYPNAKMQLDFKMTESRLLDALTVFLERGFNISHSKTREALISTLKRYYALRADYVQNAALLKESAAIVKPISSCSERERERAKKWADIPPTSSNQHLRPSPLDTMMRKRTKNTDNQISTTCCGHLLLFS